MQSLRSWWSDRLLRNVLTNSSYLFSSNAATIVLGMLQGILAARTLGAENFGILSATVIPFVSMVSRLTSFRMSELVVKYMGQYMAEEKKDQAAAVAKAALLADSLVSLLGFAILLFITPLAATYLAKDPQTAPLFTFYGIILLGNATFETATGVLQATNRFRTIALVNFGQSLITVSLILGANLTGGGINEVLIAYLVGKMFTGITLSGIALIQLGRSLGQGWWRTPLRAIPHPRALARFALSTNLSGTVNLVTRDSETLFISFFRNPTEAGYFRIALAVINLVMLPIQPFIGTTYAEIAKTIAQKKWAATTGLLKRISGLAGVWTLAAIFGLVFLGEWLIARLYGAEFGPAYPAVLILLLGYGYANILFWNRPLLLSLGMPAYPLIVAGGIGLIKTLLAFWLVPAYGFLAQAWLLTGFFLVSISVIVWRGLWEIHTRARASVPTSAAVP